MLERTAEQFDLTPSRLVADGGYGSAEMVGWLVDERGIEPHMNKSELFREQFVVAVAEDHMLAKLKEVRVPDLIGTPYLRRTNCEYGDFARTVFNQQGLFNKIVYSSDRDNWILAMAAAGMGYSFMPERSARQHGVVTKPLVTQSSGAK